MKGTEIRKQISLFVPVSEWRAIRGEAARRKIPMTELCRQWLRPQLQRLLEGSVDQAEPQQSVAAI
jgi:hypothetical protein